MPSGKAHPAQKASKLPKAIPPTSSDQSVPGAYPSSPSPATTMHGKLVPQDHRGHDHRPLLKVDLPTHEQPSGAREGVGSLPGPNTERGVAILPDERSHTHHTDSGQGLKTAGQKYELPTTEIPSGSSVGIGSMPGSIWESGVATLPEERINGRPYGQGHTGFEESLATDWKGRHLQHGDDVQVTPSNDAETLEMLSPIPPPSHERHVKKQGTPYLMGEDLSPIPPPSHPRFVTSQATPHLPEGTSETVRNIAMQVEHVAEDVVGAVEEVAVGVYSSAGAMWHSIGSHWPAIEHTEAAEPQYAQRDFKSSPGTHASLKSRAQAPRSKLPRPSEAGGTESGTPKMPALPTPGNTLTSEDDGTAAGLGGVEFYRDGKEGVLPGFPTAGGMGILIADRVNDDRLRSEAARNRSRTDSSANRVQLHRGESTASNRAVDGSISSLSPSPKEDTANEFQITEEKREVPVFMDGSQAASGRYEAVFAPADTQNDERYSTGLVTGQGVESNERSFQGRTGTTPTGRSYQSLPPQIPASQLSPAETLSTQNAFLGEQAVTAAGKVSAPISADLPSPITSVFGHKGPHIHPHVRESGVATVGVDSKVKSEGTQRSTLGQEKLQLEREGAHISALEDVSKNKLPPTLSTLEARGPASYLGKPVSKEEEKVQVEKARLVSRKKAGGVN